MRTVFPEVGDSISFVYLGFTSTCGEQPFGHTKSKASEYEQLILASNPGKSLRRSGKITIIWRNLIHTKLLQMKKNPSMDSGRQHCIFMYVYIHCFNSNISGLEYLKTFEWFCFSLKYNGFVKFSK